MAPLCSYRKQFFRLITAGEFNTAEGVKKGLIYARDPEYVAHTQTLGQPNFEERDDYIIITNWDFFWRAERSRPLP